MRTGSLIDAIAADAGTAPRRLKPAVWLALGVSIVAAGGAFEALLGPRPDMASALGTMRFPMKFVLTGALGIAAAELAMRLARPGADRRPAVLLLAGVAALLAISIGAELAAVPRDAWMARLVGRNALLCLVHIPLLSAVPLAAFLVAMRRGAPDSPARLGAASGLLAGAVGATFYAAHCPDDSPLFLGVWYVLAVGAVTLFGAAIGSRALRW